MIEGRFCGLAYHLIHRDMHFIVMITKYNKTKKLFEGFNRTEQ